MDGEPLHEKEVCTLSFTQFRGVFYVSVFLNLVRLAFLVTATIIIEIVAMRKDLEEDWWVVILCFTTANIPVLLSYLLGFSIRESVPKVSTLLEGSSKS